MNLLIFNALSWEQRKLGEVATIERGSSPRPIDAYITDASDGLNWVKIGDAPEQGRYINHTEEKIKPSGLSKTRQVFPGDLILSNSMSFGKPYIMGISGCIHDGWLLIRNSQNVFDLKFLCHMLGTDQMLKQYQSLAAGSTVNNLNKELVSNAVVSVPNKPEQERIGTFLESIDDVITLHQSKAESWKNEKNQLSTISWEQRKLGDIAKLINGRAYAQNELLPSGKYKVLRVGNFYTNDSWYCSNLELDDKYYANDGDLLYTWSATFGPHIWRGDRVIYHYHIWKIDLTDELEKHFAVQLLEQDKNDILSGHNGSTMAHITKEGMEQKKVVIPKNIGEQRQLGLFFDNLDNLITLHHRKLNRTQICINRSFLYGSF